LPLAGISKRTTVSPAIKWETNLATLDETLCRVILTREFDHLVAGEVR
jgi:hypothetical protein